MTPSAIRSNRSSSWTISIFFVSVAVMASASTNSNWFTRTWQTDEGLPNNYVNAIAQGDDGYLWVGTPAGLLRFDGDRFTPFYFPTDDADDQNVHAIVSRHAGGMWIVPMRASLIGFDAAFSQVALPADGLPAGPAQGMAEDSRGTLWILSSNVLCEVRAGQVTSFAPGIGAGPVGGAGAIVCDHDDHLWITKAGKVGLFQDGRFQQFAIPTASRVIHLAAARDHGIWAATGTQLYRCETNGSIRDCGSFDAGNRRAESWALLEDHAGGLWIGTDGSGLFRLDASGFQKIEISHPYVLSLTEDHEGNIWAGTAGGGLTRISPRGVQLEGLEDGSSMVAIQSICQDTNGVFWGATQNGLLVTRRDGKWEQALTNRNEFGRVTCVAADRAGAVWIGTRDRKFHRYRDDKLTTWTSRDGLAQHSVISWLPASNGDVWISEMGNPSAVQCLETDDHLRTFALPADAGRISDLAEDAGGGIWAASVNGLLMRADGNEFRDQSAVMLSATNPILCLYATADGSLWIGFEGGGVGRLKDGRFARVQSKQGLFDDNISEIVADAHGWLWFGSSRGIFKARQDDLEAVMEGRMTEVHPIHYGRNEGLFSIEADSVNAPPFVSPAAFRSRDGRLWLPLRTAIAVVDPAALAEDPHPLSVILTRITVDNRVIADYGDLRPGSAVANLKTQRLPLSLSPGPRKIDFDFTALNLSAPESVRFRCRLEGWDDDWFTPETRSTTYTHLAAGTYHFRVEAGDNGGAWNEAAVPFTIVVAPFFWQTWWFRVGLLALFTLSVIAAVRYVSFRRLRLKLRLVEQQAALDKERARIARDLHDDLGCSLTEIALVLNMADREVSDPAAASGQLRHCAEMVRQVAGAVDEIVWAVNPRNDTLRYVIDYISQFAVEFLHAADITCRLNMPDAIPDIPVSPEVRHNLFLVVKEAVNNITRHAGATEVRLDITADPEQITIVIADNGRGFEHAPDTATADGLRNMRDRMNEIAGEFRIESKSGSGTTIYLRCQRD